VTSLHSTANNAPSAAGGLKSHHRTRILLPQDSIQQQHQLAPLEPTEPLIGSTDAKHTGDSMDVMTPASAATRIQSRVRGALVRAQVALRLGAVGSCANSQATRALIAGARQYRNGGQLASALAADSPTDHHHRSSSSSSSCTRDAARASEIRARALEQDLAEEARMRQALLNQMERERCQWRDERVELIAEMAAERLHCQCVAAALQGEETARLHLTSEHKAERLKLVYEVEALMREVNELEERQIVQSLAGRVSSSCAFAHAGGEGRKQLAHKRRRSATPQVLARSQLYSLHELLAK
jgi:hypothetical protein